MLYVSLKFGPQFDPHYSEDSLNILGLGVTEAGLASADTQVMLDLYDLLKTVQLNLGKGIWQPPDTPNKKLCVINMDNVPNNGDILRQHMMTRAAADNDNTDSDSGMVDFLTDQVVFFNTMVDRITSQRDGSNGMVPKCEPTPAKALVICDPSKDMPPEFDNESMKSHYGLVIRNDPLQIQGDIALKLRVANATHTAIAHVMSLVSWTNTDALAVALTTATTNGDSEKKDEDTTLTAKLFMSYLDSLVEHQIKPSSFPGFGSHCPESQAAYDDWRPRLTHPHFGLSCFFITQNGAAKGGIRMGPTVLDLLQSGKPLTVTMAYAFAVLMRWLTPRSNDPSNNGGALFTGWLAGADRTATIDKNAEDSGTVSYADGLSHNLKEGWYEFRCACNVVLEEGDAPVALSEILAGIASSPRQPGAYYKGIRLYLLAADGGSLGQVAKKPDFEVFVKAVATLYARMVAGDSLVEMLEEMSEASGPYEPKGMATEIAALVDGADLAAGRPLFYRANPIPLSSQLLKAPVTAEDADSAVVSEVSSALVVDLHTHLLPPSHGPLCLWGIDELLTYVSTTNSG